MSVNSDKVVFLIDHPSRDLLVSCLIGSQLNLDYNIDFQDGYFTPQGPTFFKRAKSDEKYIITPSYNVKRTPNIKLRKYFNNAKLIMLHSEQLLAPIAFFEKFNLDSIHEFNKDVDLHLVWNSEFKNLLNSFGIPDNKIAIVGNPKFDILKIIKKDSKIFHGSVEQYETGKLLFISNFNAADYDDDSWKKYCKEYFLLGHESLNIQYKQIRNAFALSIKELEGYCRVNNKKIIIRKHPGESSEFYKELESDVVQLSSIEQLHEDLINSDLVFTFSSSVVFESFVLGIPTYAIKWGELASQLMQEPSEQYAWYSTAEISDIIKNPSSYNNAINISLFEKYFGGSDALASSKIALVLNSYISSNKGLHTKRKYSLLFYGHGLKTLLKTILNYLALIEPRFIFNFLYRKICSSYQNWKNNDHYISNEEINETKLFVSSILKKRND
jgi:surface carbohydrate biosynthesis protein